MFLVETIFDTGNAKAALYALDRFFTDIGKRIPVFISGTIVDNSGRTLSGQTNEAFWNSVSHAKPLAIGLNCALGASDMKQYIENLSKCADCYVFCYPNAGLPNAMGGYDQKGTFVVRGRLRVVIRLCKGKPREVIVSSVTSALPFTSETPLHTCTATGEEMAEEIRPFCEDNLVNAIGGCCGTGPEHIAAIRKMASAYKPRQKHGVEPLLRLSGLEPLNYQPDPSDMRSTFLNVAERCNVAGSSIYKMAIVDGDYDKALGIALQQVGARRGCLPLCPKVVL